jgi:hypothetical protein
MQCEATAYTIAAHPKIEEREGQQKTKPKRSSDFPKRCASDVPKSRKGTDRASLRSSVRKVGYDYTPGLRDSVWQIL